MNDATQLTRGLERPTVVGIGASAGGLDALVRLLSAMPSEAPMSFVVVQHLDPTHDSALSTILERKTSLSVHEVSESTRVHDGHVYVIPPGKYLAIRDCVLHLSEPEEPRGSRMAVDYFFRSLADDACEYAIGVVLSGTGTDGTAGLKEIKQAGGLTIAQNPTDAEYNGMPQSAVDSVALDFVLPAGEIAERLLTYVTHAQEHGLLIAQDSVQNRDHLNAILALLKSRTDTDFRRYRKKTLQRRIRRRMGLHQMVSVQDYLHFLNDNPRECAALKNDLLIGVTKFFRNPDAWEQFESSLLQPIIKQNRSSRPIRIWCAGCASGEEVYSLAMLCHENAKLGPQPVSFQIFATDVSNDALQSARTGLYPESVVADLSRARLHEHFHKEGHYYRVARRLRESIVFAAQNVLAHPPFSQLDLIVCRNLLIYLDRSAQRRVLEVFRFALKSGGGLFLGSSESLGDASPHFEVLHQRWRLFRRNNDASLPPTSLTSDPPAKVLAPAPPSRQIDTRPNSLSQLVQRQFVRELEIGLAVVDKEGRTIFANGPIDLYLQVAVGELTSEQPNLLDMAREGLRSKLRGLLRRVWDSHDRQTTEARVRRDGRFYRVTLTARPLRGRDDALLVSFEQAKPQPSAVVAEEVESDERIDDESAVVGSLREHIRELEHELSTTRQQLSATIEDLETANEELQAGNEESMAVNEELQAGNEELETSKEELQSLNEELVTLNNQLEIKLNELKETTDDLNNLLQSTHLPTVFVDTHFRIRRFTPSARQLFHFITSDVGRQLTDIRAEFETSNVLALAGRVLETLHAQECQVTTESGTHYIGRLQPYRTEDDQIRGVVMTFTDVTELERSKRVAEERLAELETIYESTPIGLSFVDRDGIHRSINHRLAAINGVSVENTIGKSLAEILPEPLCQRVEAYYAQIYETGQPIDGIEITGQTQADDHPRDYLVSYHPVVTGDDTIVGVNAVVQDVTEQKQLQNTLEASELRFRRTFENAAVGIALVARDGRWLRVNGRLCEIVGYSEREMLERTFQDITHPDDLDADLDNVEKVLTGEIATYSMEKRYLRKDQQTIWVNLTVSFVNTGDEADDYFISVIEDISERKRTELDLRTSEERLKQIADSTDHVFWITSIDPETVLYVSPAYERIWKKDPVALYENPRLWVESIHEHDRETAEAAFERVVSDRDQGTFDVEYRIVRKDESGEEELRWISDRGTRICDDNGKPVRIAGVARDITERKNLLLEVQAREQKLASLISSTAEGIYGLDMHGVCTFANEAAVRLLGYDTPDEFVGRNMHELIQHSHADGSHYSEAECVFCRAYRAGEEVHCDEEVFWRRDGSQFAVEYWSYPQYENGELVGCVVTFLDVTERRRWQSDLADREAHLRRVIDNMASYVAILDRNGVLIDVNDAAIIASDASREEVIGKFFWETPWWTFSDAVKERVQDAFEQVLAGQSVRYDTEVRTRGDERMTIDFMMVPVFDDDGEITHVIPSGINVSARVVAERELREAKTKLDIAIRAGDIAAWRWDLAENSPVSDDNLKQVFGFERDEVPSLDEYFGRIHESDRQRVRDAVAASLRGEAAYDEEYRIVLPDGDVRWLQANGMTLFDENGQIEDFVGIVIDVTDRKNVQLRTEARESELRRTIDNLQCLVGVLDIEGRFTEVNAVLLESTPRPRDNVIGRELWDMDWWVDDAVEQQRIRHKFECAARGEATQFDVSANTADGAAAMWDFTLAPVFDDAGQVRQVIASALDVTERYQQAKKLAESQQRFDQALTAAEMGAFRLDLDADVATFSPQWCDVMGVPNDIPQTLASYFRDVHPDDIDRLRTTIDQTRAGSREFACEFRIVRASDGDVRDIAASGEWLDPSNGDGERLVGLQWDITESKQRERALSESRLKLEIGMKAARLCLGEIDYTTETVHLSPEGAKLFGVVDVEIAREEIHALIHPDDKQEVMNKVAAYLRPGSGGKFFAEHRIIRPDGKTRWVETHKSASFDAAGQPLRGILACRDVTNRKQIEFEVRVQTERMSIAAEAAGFGTMHVDVIAGNVWYSPELKSLLGFDPDAEIAVGLGDVPEFVHPDDHDAVSAHLNEILSSPQPATYRHDHRVVGPDGEVRWVRLQSRTLFDDSQQGPRLSQIFATLLDISREKQREVELEQAMTAAKAAYVARGEFLANMSHEIRTPMTAILGYADLLATHLDDPDNLQCVQTIRRNGRFLLDIINDILDLSKIDSGKMELRQEPVKPEKVLADVVSLMNVRAEEKDLQLLADFDGPVPQQFFSDSKRIKQVLINLTGNAIKFTDTGSVEITGRYDRSSGKMMFDVEDSGIGISDTDIERLFQPFTQVDASNTRSFGGTGLGLSISRRLAEMLGGELVAESQLGKGSRFRFSFDPGPIDDVPLVQPSLLTSSPAISDTVVTLSGRYLIVDDRRDIRFLAQTFIEQAGGTVTTANDGKEAVQLVMDAAESDAPFDVVLMDMQMPVMDGYTAAAEIRRRGISTPIVALTANAMAEDREKCLEAGCNEFLTKPLDRNAVLQAAMRFEQQEDS